MTLSVTNQTKQRLPWTKSGLSFVKDKVLGKKYNLSLVFASPSEAKKINKQYRNKSYVPNVLSFELDKESGEIFICPETAKKECVEFNMSYKKFIMFLFIHGMLHLKGLDHGEEMDKLEIKFLNSF